MGKTDFLLLNTSCNTENTSYAAETLLAMHQAFEEVYGEGYVEEDYGMIMMPAVVKGTESGIKALALVTLDLESAGEHWGIIFLTPGGPLEQGNAELTEEQKKLFRNFDDCVTRINEIEKRFFFRTGFRLGVRITTESYTRES